MPYIKQQAQPTLKSLIQKANANLQRLKPIPHKRYLILYSVAKDYARQPTSLMFILRQIPEAEDCAIAIRDARKRGDRQTSTEHIARLREICQAIMDAFPSIPEAD